MGIPTASIVLKTHSWSTLSWTENTSKVLMICSGNHEFLRFKKNHFTETLKSSCNCKLLLAFDTVDVIVSHSHSILVRNAWTNRYNTAFILCTLLSLEPNYFVTFINIFSCLVESSQTRDQTLWHFPNWVSYVYKNFVWTLREVKIRV